MEFNLSYILIIIIFFKIKKIYELVWLNEPRSLKWKITQTKNSINTPSLNIQPYTKQKSRMKNAR